MNMTSLETGKAPFRSALEDTVVVMLFSMLALLMATASNCWPPEPGILWSACLTGGLAGTVTYARKRGIVLPSKKEEEN